MIKEEQLTQFLQEEKEKVSKETKEEPANTNHVDEDQDLPQIQASGRNDFLLREGCVVASRNVPIPVIEEYVQSLNKWSNGSQHPNFHSQGPLDEGEVKKVTESILRYKKPKPITMMTEDQAVAFMNSKHAIVMISGRTLILKESLDPALKRPRIERSSTSDIRNFYTENVRFKNRTGPLGDFWLKHPLARRYEGVYLLPGAPADGKYFNLWRGFGVNAKAGDCQRFHDHLLNIICQGNQLYYEYSLNWLARMVQHPDTPGEVAIALIGGKGTGKSLLAQYIGRLMGAHFLPVSSMRYLSNNFNSHLANTVFMFCDEAFWAGDKAADSTLKALITEPTLVIEPKNVDPYEVRNYLHILMASNNSWVVPASEDERRYFVLEISNERRNDHTYFEKFIAEMNGDGPAALLHELLERDISTFNVRSVPETEALKNQKIESFTPAQEWWLERLRDGRQTEDATDWLEEIESQRLVESFSKSVRSAAQRVKSHETALGKFLRKQGIKKQTPMISGVRKSFYLFPLLEECRAKFEEELGFKIDWPKTGETTAEDHEPLPY